ncbi:two-component sensor histidine kinase [Roseibium aquae]|uniref:histidine kinase n=1 Tax=Roseibium aquae TaxID=1323746 RepID=A0A916TNV1_9HYPH|nr:HAMP domain-containing sensor histidine kinase [Roseibium aquae]GGB63131.1 two-component sensor histidine kinase [Roseibium aquae]
MNRLARLARTTAFKLSILYFAVFTGLTGFLLVYISQNTNRLMLAQVTQTLNAEITGLPEEYARGGVRALVASIDSRARRPDASLYLLTDFAGNLIAGNIRQMPRIFLDEQEGGFQRVHYLRLTADGAEEQREALVRIFDLRGGYRLLVGRDLGETRILVNILSEARILWIGVVVIMALVTWVFVNRRVMRRIDDIADTSRTIMQGDLSGRLPMAGTDDEFDRLAGNLNRMLERIEVLMQGMKDVTDNIAHDLKTPLTRLRTRVETALRDAKTDAEYREALEATLDESDNLIRIFNSLLHIARIEAMASGDAMEPVDLKPLIEELADLYAPLAEDCGGALEIRVEPGLAARCNAGLITQVLVNLIENALKYAGRAGTPLKIEVSAQRRAGRAWISVSDNGPGIPADMRGSVTDRFVRLDESRSEPGHGLGLSLVRAVARLHGGEVELQDAAPGLTVSFDLALENLEEDRARDERDGRNGAGRRDR